MRTSGVGVVVSPSAGGDTTDLGNPSLRAVATDHRVAEVCLELVPQQILAHVLAILVVAYADIGQQVIEIGTRPPRLEVVDTQQVPALIVPLRTHHVPCLGPGGRLEELRIGGVARGDPAQQAAALGRGVVAVLGGQLGEVGAGVDLLEHGSGLLLGSGKIGIAG